LNEPKRAGKYARFERERRFLVQDLPDGINQGRGWLILTLLYRGIGGNAVVCRNLGANLRRRDPGQSADRKPVEIRASGLSAREVVTLQATTKDASGKIWVDHRRDLAARHSLASRPSHGYRAKQSHARSRKQRRDHVGALA
jgi:hypothetical protein